MRFLVDAQLPRRLAVSLRTAGYDAIHTLDLPNGNRTPDSEINEISIREQRIVITKDADFVDSFMLLSQPHKLFLISTGNITNAALIALLVPHLPAIVATFETNDFVELNREAIVIHR